MEQIEAKRKEREQRRLEKMQAEKKKQEEKQAFHRQIKKGILTGMLGLAGLAGVIYGVKSGFNVLENHRLIQKQEQVYEVIKNVPLDRVIEIRKKYDLELYSLIEAYHYGEKLNGMIWSPRNAVFAAHSNLMSKYNAYNPNAYDENRTPEDWVLLDHMCYRYYQYKAMNLSNKLRERKNPYLDMLRLQIEQPSLQRVPVRHADFFEGLKLNRVMER